MGLFINNVLWRHLKSCLFVAFVFIHQSHSPLCSFFTKTKSTKNTIKTVPTYYFTVTKVRVVKNKDVTKTQGYQEAMDDIKAGRIYHAENADEMFKQIFSPFLF